MTRRRLCALFVIALSSAGSACNVLFSLDDYTAPTLGSCSSCAADECQCAPKAPAGFDHARLRVAKPSDLCPQGTIAGVAMGQGTRDTGCTCGCDSPTSVPCGLSVFTSPDCTGAPAQTITAGLCTAFTDSGSASAAVRPVGAAACAVQAKLALPDFDVRVLACLDQLPSSEGCDERTTCTARLDAPFDPSPCIVAKPGAQVSCPDSYSHKYVFATGFDDQRTCDASGCACSSQKCAGTTVTVCADALCQDTPKCARKAEGLTGCLGFTGLTHGTLDNAGSTDGQCAPSGDAASVGTLTASGSVIVCCRDTLAKGTSADGGA